MRKRSSIQQNLHAAAVMSRSDRLRDRTSCAAAGADNWIKNRWSSLQNHSYDEDVPSLCVKGVLQAGYSEGWTSTVLGYKILEKRSKFTVYKILVRDSKESWIIFRRYTDFCKLNNKLKELFPSILLPFPPKCRFKNTFGGDFLKTRQIQLQLFLEKLALHKDMYNCDIVRHFLHLVNSPDLFESLDESRAFCESLEEINHRLQRALSDKQREVDVLKETLEKRQNHLEHLMKKIK
ncbi:sorting nexin-16-like [Boleophthalmus pectinirostris]|uniref:sorting nexin-16-like n=1 Tax=Boleophthalmus pectinirostris TaxID=150288 RepID=UPI002431E823|nr:sorting nexin-16-like [Boleophthalmus pectinirostris]